MDRSRFPKMFWLVVGSWGENQGFSSMVTQETNYYYIHNSKLHYQTKQLWTQISICYTFLYAAKMSALDIFFKILSQLIKF